MAVLIIIIIWKDSDCIQHHLFICLGRRFYQLDTYLRIIMCMFIFIHSHLSEMTVAKYMQIRCRRKGASLKEILCVCLQLFDCLVCPKNISTAEGG